MLKILLYILIIIGLYIFKRYFEFKHLYFPQRLFIDSPDNWGLQYEDIYFRTQDGKKLNGWLFTSNDGKITILFCHGNAGNISYRIYYAERFVEKGYNFFIFDYRGYGKSEGIPSQKGLLLDALSAYEWLTVERGINPEDVIIMGESLGAVIAIWLATRVDAMCLVAEAPFTSVADMAKEIYRIRPPLWALHDKYPAEKWIKKIKMPVLIFHSMDDEVVPFWMGQSIFKSAPEPKKFVTIRGEHCTGIEDPDYLPSITNFIEKIKFDKK